MAENRQGNSRTGWQSFLLKRSLLKAKIDCALVCMGLWFSRRLSVLKYKLGALPQTAALGRILYSIGFETEYRVRTGWHSLGVGLQRLGKGILAVLAAVGGFLGAILGSVWGDLTAPFVTFGKNFVNLFHTLRTGRKEQNRVQAAKTGFSSFFKGLGKSFLMLGGILSYVLPVLAAMLMYRVVKDTLAYRYVLAVEVNGQTVGYVQDESVFDDARAAVAARIESVNSTETAESWTVQPSYTLAVAGGSTLNQNEMADAILSTSSDKIQEATALYVDGNLIAVTTEGDRLRSNLQAILDQHLDPNNPNLTAGFVQDVQEVDGIYFTDSIEDYSVIDNLLNGYVQEDTYYTIEQGDTPSGVAQKNGLTTAEMYALNPEMAAADYNMPIGGQVKVTQSRKFLQVKTIERRTYTVTVPFESVTEESGEYAWGTTKTVQEGVDGEIEITSDFVTIDGVETEQEVSRTTLVEMVPQKTVKGTKLPSGGNATVASGNWLWPVPNYRYVSRWMSSYHNGADICAAYGSAIIASDSGVVITSTYHYSYGNYIVIDHGNGWRTLYAHCSALYVGVGQAVSRGQVIGAVGSTGNSTGNHCHFSMYRNGGLYSAWNFFGGSVKTF